MYVHYTVLSKELLNYWATKKVKVEIRQKFIREIQLSTVSAKTDIELSFSADWAYVWEKDSKCTAMKWEESDKLLGSFTYISVERFKKWFISYLKPNSKHNTNENRLQKQKLMSSEEMTQKEIECKVESAKLQLQSDILATKQSKFKAEAELEAAKHTYPLDTPKIIECQAEVEAYTEGLAKLEALMTELF